MLLDDLPSHPKILRAGEALGPHGVARVLALYVSAIGYARTHMTDGFVPNFFLGSKSNARAAEVMSWSSVGLFRRVRGGYQIHDFHDFNRSANEEKDFRAKERARVAAWREKQNGRKS